MAAGRCEAPFSFEDEEPALAALTDLDKLRHSAAHVMADAVQRLFPEAKLTIGPRAVKDMLEHFPIARGPKSDPQIVWSFRDEEVILKGLDLSQGTSGTRRAQHTTN